MIAKTRGKNSRLKILEKAGTLFAEKGYDHTSMKNIARVCNFDAANLYNYFQNKETILFEVLKETMGKPINSIVADSNDITDPLLMIETIIKSNFKHIIGMKRSYRLLVDAELMHLSRAHRKKYIEIRDEYDRIIYAPLRKALDSNRFSDSEVKIIGYFIVSMIIRTEMWFSPSGELSLEEIADLMCQFVLGGLKSMAGGKDSKSKKGTGSNNLASVLKRGLA